jgi:shikimate kinase
MRLFIIGFKSSGKSTLGKELAKRLNLEFLDLDDFIETLEGRPVTEIFATDGENEFRMKEREALEKAVKKDNILVSTGGGTPRHFDNMKLMQENGLTIYLKVDNETLVSRMKLVANERPILKGKTENELREYVGHLIRDFEHYYLLADYIVEGSNITTDQIIAMIPA